MLPTKKTKKLLAIGEVSGETQQLEVPLKNEILFEDSKSVLDSIDKLYLFDENTERFYSRFASKLLILSFIFDYSRELNSRIEDKYKIEPIDILPIIKGNKSKKYYKDKVRHLEKDKLISWFTDEGLPILDDCLDRKQYAKLKDVISIGINLDLLKEYLSRIEDDSDLYEILSQFRKAFEKYPATIRKCEFVYYREEDVHDKTTIIQGRTEYKTDFPKLNNVEWDISDVYL